MNDLNISEKPKLKSRVDEKLNCLFTCLFLIWALTPYLNRNMHNVYVIIFIIGWVSTAIITVLRSKKITINRKGDVIVATSFWLVTVSIYILIQNNVAFGNYVYIILYYIPIFMAYYYIRKNNRMLIRKILLIFLMIAFINVISNIGLLFENPYAAKEATGSYGFIDYSQTNIITDHYAFSYVLIATLGIIGTIMEVKKKPKIAFIILSILTVIMIVQSTFFIAMISFFVLLLRLFIVKDNNKLLSVLRAMFLAIIVILSILLVNVFSDSIKLFFASLIDNSIILNRINLIIDFASNYSLSGTLEARVINIQTSINTFIKHPIFGRGYIINFNLVDTGIGNHSYIFDSLARMGILGFFIEILVYVIFAKFMKNHLNKMYNRFYSIVWWGFVFYSLFNPIAFPQVGVMLFLIFPLYIFYKNSTNHLKEKRLFHEEDINVEYFTSS